METRWLDPEERAAWLRLVTLLELMPGVLDTQLRQEAELTHFEYFVLAMLSEAPEHTLRMTALAAMSNASLPRLSHVVKRLEVRELIERRPAPEDRRATNAVLTEAGWAKVRQTAPGHVEHVRRHVFDLLSREQVAQLEEIAGTLLRTIPAARDRLEAWER